jgi:HEAT repeat protein
MKCEECETLMIDYLDGKLDSNRNQEIEKHLEICEKCLDELKDTRRILELMSKDEMIKPDDSLRINFYNMLHSEINKIKEQPVTPFESAQVSLYNRSVYRFAAGIALLIIGTLIGIVINSGVNYSSQSKELGKLKSEVNALRETAIYSMLKNESSSFRIQAVNYSEEIDVPDENIIDALVKTLNNDRNVNVRMAAAYALAKFTSQGSVREALVKSLSLQNDPILQVTLINILVDMDEKSALDPIRKILNSEETLEEVKSVAAKGARLLI